MGAGYEATIPAARRRAEGIHYTPPDVADRIVALAFGDGLPLGPVCDPACGAGAFLLAAGRALEAAGVPRQRSVRDLLWGIDRDPDSVATCRAALTAWAGVSPGRHIRVADGLAPPASWRGRFAAVVGNPPFLNQLQRSTVRREPLPPGVAELARPYTDTAWLFLAVALDVVAPGGAVALVQPQSVCAARDAAAVRDRVVSSAVLTDMVTLDGGVFAAEVRVCVPVLRRGHARAAVRRWAGRSFMAHPPVPHPDATSWAGLLVVADPPPLVVLDLDDGGGILDDLAVATAGFRDEFYGLLPHLVDVEEADDSAAPRVVTSGLIDAGRSSWGERTARIGGRRWSHPRLDLRSFHAAGPPRLRRWVAARLEPKVVVASQTKVIEAVADPSGTTVPMTPVIAVHPHDGDPWPAAAVLLAPPVTAWAASRWAGVALASGALKVSARQLLGVPLPADHRAWGEGRRALKAGDIAHAAATMTKAYGADDEVTAWWSRRAGVAP